MFFSNKRKHVETAAEIKAKKIKIGWGKFAIELTFSQLLALILVIALSAGFVRGGFFIKTKWFTYNKPPMTEHLLNQQPSKRN